MSFEVKFPDTEINAVPPKASILESRSEEFRDNSDYDPRRDITIDPAVREFTHSCKETLNQLTDSSVDGEKVFNHRKCKLFFYNGVLEYLNVNQLRQAMRDFVEGLPLSHPRHHQFYAGPNYIKDPDWYLLTNKSPVDPFTFLRLHNLILAAEAADFRPVTNMTGLRVTTQHGFDDGAFISSVWVANPKLVRDVLAAGGEKAEDEVIHGLQTNYGSWASRDLFSEFILKSLRSTKRTDQVWYGLTKKFAMAMYSELQKIAENADTKIAPFDLMFPSDYSSSHDDGNRRVKALPKSDGNLL